MMHLQYTLRMITRFWTKVDKSAGPTGCWPWLAALFKATGYGQFCPWHGKTITAHRFAWEVTNGPIPEGMQIRHVCPGGGNRACVNPLHLRLGTHQDNMDDRTEQGRTARGDKAGPRTHPERYPRGDNHPARLHPERLPHGERQHLAKMTAEGVREMRRLADEGATLKELGARFGISTSSAHSIVARKTWKHVA